MLLLWLGFIGAAPAAQAVGTLDAPTAFAVLKNLPPEQRGRLARIEARDGTPLPERWYVLVQASDTEAGLREFVFAGKDLIAVRTLSQFARGLQAQDIIGNSELKIDSDDAQRRAQEYATANAAIVSAFNYTLARSAASGGPAWTVSCLDARGNVTGSITIDALSGKVLAREGFPVEPPESRAGRSRPTPRSSAPTTSKRRVSSERPVSAKARKPLGQVTAHPNPPSTPPPVRRAEAVAPPAQAARNPFRRLAESFARR